jgi:hypothetical protein
LTKIIKGKKINTKNINSASFATKSFLMGKDLSTIEKFKDLLSQVLIKIKKKLLKLSLNLIYVEEVEQAFQLA